MRTLHLPLGPYDLGPPDDWPGHGVTDAEPDELAPDEFPCTCDETGVCGPCAMEETR